MTKRRYVSALSTTVLIAALTAPAAFGVSVSGRLTSSVYTYEVYEGDGTAAGRARAYQLVRLDVGHGDVSAHAYARASSNLKDMADSRNLGLFMGYLAWGTTGRQVRVGRQSVHTGTGYGTIDGVRLQLTRYGIGLSAFAGPQVPLDRSLSIEDWSDARLSGVRLTTQRVLGTSLSASLTDRLRRPRDYLSTGTFSGLSGQRPGIRRRLLGFDASRHVGAHDLHARLEYDLLDDSIRRSEVSGRFRLLERLSAQAEWSHRQPYVFYNSIFSAFPSRSYQELSTLLRYQVDRRVSISARIANVFYSGDDTRRLGITASLGDRYSLGYHWSSGYGLGSNGLAGSLYYPVTPKLTVLGQLDVVSFERFLSADERQEVITGLLGTNYRPNRRVFLELQLQALRNIAYQSDVRVFVRGSWRFFRGQL